MVDHGFTSNKVATSNIRGVGCQNIHISAQPISLFVCFVVPWIFDHPSLPGEDIIVLQYTILAISCFAFLVQQFSYRCTPVTGALRTTLGLFGMWLVPAALIGLIRGQDFSRVVATAIPMVIFMISSIFTYRFLCACRDLEVFRKILFHIIVIFTVWTIYLRLGLEHLDINDVRYRILPATVEIFSAYVVTCLFARFRFVDIAGATLHFGVLLIAVTRAEFVRFFAMCALGLLQHPKFLTGKLGLSRIAIIVTGLVAIGGTGVVSGTGLADEWFARIFSYELTGGTDITGLLRIGEADYQFGLLAESFQTFLFGLGLAEPVRVSDQYLTITTLLSGYDSSDYSSYGFIDCEYSSLLFTGGILFGSFAIAANVYLFWIAVRVLRVYLPHSRTNYTHFLGTWGALGVIGCIIAGITAGVFDGRSYGMAFGLCVGMMLWAKDQVEAATNDSGYAQLTTTEPVPALNPTDLTTTLRI